MLSHGAIIAREFGIPSIVGVADATRLIPTGATICLDGDRGAVRLIADADVITSPPRASVASEPRERSAPSKRRARERVGESEGQSPSEQE